MKVLAYSDLNYIHAGEIIPGNPTNYLNCINVKLMISAGRGEPGFDVGVAADAYMKYCSSEDINLALNYAREGNSGFAFLKEILFSLFFSFRL